MKTLLSAKLLGTLGKRVFLTGNLETSNGFTQTNRMTMSHALTTLY